MKFRCRTRIPCLQSCRAFTRTGEGSATLFLDVFDVIVDISQVISLEEDLC